MRVESVALVMIYLVLSLVLLPQGQATLDVIVTGNAGIPDIRGYIDHTIVNVTADSQVQVKGYNITCVNETNKQRCSHVFDQSNLSQGSYAMRVTQLTGTPTQVMHSFAVDDMAPQINRFEIEQGDGRVQGVISVTDNAYPGSTLCAGVGDITIIAESSEVLNVNGNGSCDYTKWFNITQPLSGDLSFFAVVQDRLGLQDQKTLHNVSVDTTPPDILDDVIILSGNGTVTVVASNPVLVPLVDIKIIIMEDRLSSIVGDLSEFTQNPRVDYSSVIPQCDGTQGRYVCTFSNIQLSPTSSPVTLGITATDGEGNTAEKNLTYEFTFSQTQGEITSFKPQQCVTETCYIKKGINVFTLDITPGEGDISPQMITIAGDGGVNRAARCDEGVRCYVYIPVTSGANNVAKQFLITNPTTDSLGMPLTGVLESEVMLDNQIPVNITPITIKPNCPIAGETAHVRVNVTDNSPVKLFAQTKNISAKRNHSTTCTLVDTTYVCDLQMTDFVSYAATENVTFDIIDSAMNNKSYTIEMSSCEAQNNYAPSFLRDVKAVSSFSQRIDRRVASAMALKVYIPLDITPVSSSRPMNIGETQNNLRINRIVSDGCVGTPQIGGEPYFIDRMGDKPLLVVPIGGSRTLLPDTVDINCTLSIYLQKGSTRYSLPEIESFHVGVESYNLELGRVDDATKEKLSTLEKEISELQEEIDSRTKIHSILNMLCKIAKVIGYISGVVALVKSVIYSILLAIDGLLGWTGVVHGIVETVWQVVCQETHRVNNWVTSTIWPPGMISPSVGMITKWGCIIYNCGLCKASSLITIAGVVGQSAVGGMSSSVTDTIDNEDGSTTYLINGEQITVSENGEAGELTTVTRSDDTVTTETRNNGETTKTDMYFPDSNKRVTLEGGVLTFIDHGTGVTTTVSGDESSSSTVEDNIQPPQGGIIEGLQGVDIQNNKAEKVSNSEWIVDPYKSIHFSRGCLCNPGMIYNYEKLKQLKCRYHTCLSEHAQRGLPTNTCDMQFEQAKCLYYDSATYKKYGNWAFLKGLGEALLQNAIGIAQAILCYDDYIPEAGTWTMCSSGIWGGWRPVACGITESYLMMQEWEFIKSNPFADGPLSPIDEGGYDYCEEAGFN